MSNCTNRAFLQFSLFFFLLFSVSTAFTQSKVTAFGGFDYGAGIALQWETRMQPQEGDYFTIERLLNGNTDFEVIADLPATEEMLQQVFFLFEDTDLGIEKARYRITCYGKNDTYKFESSTVEVTKDVVNNFKITGTELLDKGQYAVNIYSIIEGDLNYRLSTFDGEMLEKESLRMVKGENTYVINLNNSPATNFTTIFSNGGYSITKNFKKKITKDFNMARKDKPE